MTADNWLKAFCAASRLFFALINAARSELSLLGVKNSESYFGVVSALRRNVNRYQEDSTWRFKEPVDARSERAAHCARVKRPPGMRQCVVIALRSFLPFSGWKRRLQKKARSFPFLPSCPFPILQRKLHFVSCSFPVSFPFVSSFPLLRLEFRKRAHTLGYPSSASLPP